MTVVCIVCAVVCVVSVMLTAAANNRLVEKQKSKELVYGAVTESLQLLPYRTAATVDAPAGKIEAKKTVTVVDWVPRQKEDGRQLRSVCPACQLAWVSDGYSVCHCDATEWATLPSRMQWDWWLRVRLRVDHARRGDDDEGSYEGRRVEAR